MQFYWAPSKPYLLSFHQLVFLLGLLEKILQVLVRHTGNGMCYYFYFLPDKTVKIHFMNKTVTYCSQP